MHITWPLMGTLMIEQHNILCKLYVSMQLGKRTHYFLWAFLNLCFLLEDGDHSLSELISEYYWFLLFTIDKIRLF